MKRLVQLYQYCITDNTLFMVHWYSLMKGGTLNYSWRSCTMFGQGKDEIFTKYTRGHKDKDFLGTIMNASQLTKAT